MMVALKPFAEDLYFTFVFGKTQATFERLDGARPESRLLGVCR
jgi:hypothetical protein